MSATSVSDAILSLSRQLAEGLRDGTALVSDARVTAHNIREAQGWLISAHGFLNPDDPLSASLVEQERTDES